MRQLYGPCVVCDASLAPDPMAKSGNSLKEGQNRNGVDQGCPGLVIGYRRRKTCCRSTLKNIGVYSKNKEIYFLTEL